MMPEENGFKKDGETGTVLKSLDTVQLTLLMKRMRRTMRAGRVWKWPVKKSPGTIHLTLPMYRTSGAGRR
jgi:hypothetical protein